MTFSKLSVVMPVYNEARSVEAAVNAVMKSSPGLEIELICVDDGSTDGSTRILERLSSGDDRVVLLKHDRNLGKGRAIRTAIDAVSGDVTIIQDADLEYDPKDYGRVIGPILQGDADAVYGSRFAASEVRRVLMFWHSFGNKVLTTLANMANDLNLTDVETCYKAIRTDLLKSLKLTSDRFGFEPEVTARLAQSGARIFEVPISYYGRTYTDGKKIGWRDGVEAMWLILKFRFLDKKPEQNAAHANLESLKLAPHVSEWMLSSFKSHLGERVLEAGCGSGNLTDHLTGVSSLVAIDFDPEHVEEVARRFSSLEHVEVRLGDLEEWSTYDDLGVFDSVLCTNVLEHLHRPDLALAGFRRVLKPGGHVMVLVPAHKWLFSAADVAIDHRMRYTEAEVVALLESKGFEIVKCGQFNRLGIVGWTTNKLLGKTTISGWQARMFGLMLPLAKFLERFDSLPGLSVVAVATTSAD